ncbi:MAG: FAD-binding oxidoreductase [Candidatus Abyssobacteria bacterium SURF_5]|uniref:FAD-binding oxidoreductase n=1 Tax=Abyssobacteria bacterium (strain SURF_5) TaxID=2093360 RepID=A0A3A4NKJ4_ABYX5|nr:MAG: FAD-binding oxidoreductase [Candidatus Abyssubacteria bacterium SURF_5]
METEKLVELLGAEHVSDAPDALADYAKDHSFAPVREPWSVVRPHSLEQVQEVIKYAAAAKTPLVPVSSGPPRFRGDTVPSYGGIMLDMSGMNRIRMIDRKDRVAMIEPGVRFGQLQDALRAEGLRLPMPLCPRSTKSVVGSCLEREPHIMPRYHLDHSDPLLCNEVVFGTGDIFRTGEAGGPGSIEEQQAAGRRQKIAMGIQMNVNRILQGSQGAFGVVTWSTVRCEVLPKRQKPFLAAGADLPKLMDLAYWLVRLRLGDEIFILNNVNFALLFGGDRNIRQLQETLPRWILFFCLSGLEYFPEERIEQQEKDMAEIAKNLGVPIAESVCGISAREVLSIATAPSHEPYWKLEWGGGCQDLPFICSFEQAPALVQVMRDAAAADNFPLDDLGIYIQPVCQGHGHHVEFSLFHEAGNQRKREKTKALYLSAARALMESGAFFSRPYDLLADMVFNRDAASRDALRKLKNIFDPHNILNPGKLCF